MLRPPAPVIRSSPFDVGALLNACIIIIININYYYQCSEYSHDPSPTNTIMYV